MVIINTGIRKPAITLEQVAKGLGAEVVGIKNTSDPVAAAHGARLASEQICQKDLPDEIEKIMIAVLDNGEDNIKEYYLTSTL